MDMIAMLNGLGVAAPGSKKTTPTPPVMYTQAAPAGQAMAPAAAAANTIADKVKSLSEANLLGAAQAAISGIGYGDSSPEQIKAAGPQLYAEVVARYGPGKLAELAGYQSAAASAAMVQAATAKQAEEYAKQAAETAKTVSPMMAGAIGLAAGALLGWFIARR